MTELDYQRQADVGAAIYDALGREPARGRNGIDVTVDNRRLLGEKVAARLRDFGLKIIEDRG